MQRPDEKHLGRKKEKGGKVNSSLIKWRPADMKKHDEPEIAKWRLGKNNKLTPCRMHAKAGPWANARPSGRGTPQQETEARVCLLSSFRTPSLIRIVLYRDGRVVSCRDVVRWWWWWC